LAGGKTSDAIGRKWTMAFAAVIFQSGGSLATSFTVMIGRFLAGIGIGFGVMIAPVYIAESNLLQEDHSLPSLNS
ncbi:UNVERIFIED_CONTAM: putative polyol transporter 4, partial [Sesamum radiatum]